MEDCTVDTGLCGAGRAPLGGSTDTGARRDKPLKTKNLHVTGKWQTALSASVLIPKARVKAQQVFSIQKQGKRL